ncbi:regulator of nonsense transcripts 3A-like isoform X1 [Biomphalaria pfeifferi]|uniref:Regulator of nonsense transcripts 3A-like isoform X1 n=1 Tax=Biomphalaria pfeifferi TaxID=112525 RepID=A0AAD8B8Q4_BIOPF|nr:regulator of nonsense transcripts 3A-like isoform X1 [Biomphalaria pfeifferi]
MTLGTTAKNDTDMQKPPLEKKKEKDHTPTKVVIRRLPPSLTPEEFVQQVSPLPEYDFFYFVRADMSLGQNAFTRAYINFLVPEDIFIFRDKFDGYVFLDAKVEKQDSDYKKFVENLSKPADVPAVSLDAMVVEVETKENSFARSGSSRVSTPLLEYLRKRREERKLNIAKLKEERRRGGGMRDSDRKRSGNDDLDRRKSSDKDRMRDRDRHNRDRDRLRERDRIRDRRREKDPPRSDRLKEDKDGERKWMKDTEGTPKMLLRNTERDNVSYDNTAASEKPTIVLEREKKEDKDLVQERLSEPDAGKGFRDRRSEEIRMKRSSGGTSKWDERRREDDRQRGGRVRGYDDDRGRSYKDQGARSFRDDTDRRPLDRDKNRGERYTDRGYKYGSSGGYRDKFKEDRGGNGRRGGYNDRDDGRGSGDRDRDERKGGLDREERRDAGKDREERRNVDRDDRKIGAGDGWKRKEFETKKFEKPVDRKPEFVRSKISEDGKKEGSSSSGRESLGIDSTRDDKSKEEDRSNRGGGPSDQQTGWVRGDAGSQSQRSTPDMSPPRHSKDDNDGRGDNIEGDEKKRKKKDRPERQIYIPRRALERQRQSSPQTSESGKDRPKESSS